MRVVSVVFLSVVVLASASKITDFDDKVIGNMDLKAKQMMIFKLFNHITEPVMYKEIEDIVKNFSIEECTDCYTRTDVVKTFIGLFKFGMLPRGEIFTLNIDRQMKQVVTMFHMLYYAKDFTTFIKTACWMRMYCNEGMFVYAMNVACRHREDCKGIILPPPYEVYPYYFVRADVIQKAYMLKMRRGLIDHKLCDLYGIKKTDKDVYIIDENIFDRRAALNNNDNLRYFTEDIGLNTYFYYFHVDYPFWMTDNVMRKAFKTRRWEMVTYVYQQILARYNLERLSLGMDNVRELTTKTGNAVKEGYIPWMMLHNGVQMSMRMNGGKIIDDMDIPTTKLYNTYEMIIRESIMKGFIEIDGKRLELTKPEDIEALGMMVYGKVSSPDNTHVEVYRYMFILMKAVLGLNTLESDKNFVMPTVFDSYQTALRDPLFYRLQKNLVDMWHLFKLRLPIYTREELYFPGVKIDNVVVDKLETYYDHYLMDMTNAVTLTKEEITKQTSDMKFLVRKRRLNHQPFTITVNVDSDKTVDSVVRIFLGPKTDNNGRVIEFNTNRVNFVELDSFLYKLTTGKNTIVRESKYMHNFVNDRIMTRDLWKKMDTIGDIKDIFMKELRNWHTGFPTRLMLPRGRVGGCEMLLYVIVSPLKMVDNNEVNLLDTNCKRCDFRSTTLLDKMPLGFPLDRKIDAAKFFTPNMKFAEVMIYHKNTACDMKTRWNRYVINEYPLKESMTLTNMGMYTDTYMTDVEIKDRHTDMDF